MKRGIFGGLGILLVLACTSMGAPEPAIVQAPGQWTLETQFAHPQQLVLQRGSDNKPVRFWYVIVTLTNTAGRDVDFYPKCDLMTDTFQIIPAGRFVPAAAFEQIKARHKSRYPFLEPLEKVGNKILQGQDNTKDIAIIWPDFDVRAKTISLFITGLSNETIAVDHPVSKDAAGQPLKVFLQKTLEINYSIKGDAALRSGARLDYEGKCWVMR